MKDLRHVHAVAWPGERVQAPQCAAAHRASPANFPVEEAEKPDGPPQSGEESELIARARTGDVGAFESLYRLTAGRIFALCLRMCGDRLRARELAHDVFVRAWEKLPSFREESAFGSWLHRLAVNYVLEVQRSDRRRTARVSLADDEADDAAVRWAGAVRPDHDARIDLERAMALLPPNARTVFVLHEVEGYKHDEIARMMGTAGGTVRAHLHRARKLLMELLSR